MLAHSHSSRFHRSVSDEARQKQQKGKKSPTTAYKWLDTACWDGKIYLSLREEEPQRNLTALWSFKVAFELYLTFVINGRIPTLKAGLLFCRGRAGETRIDWAYVRDQAPRFCHMEDAAKRITRKDFTTFSVQMGSLKLQFTHIFWKTNANGITIEVLDVI